MSFARVSVLVFLAGCDPGWSVSGTVVDSAGAAISGATVTSTCPGRAPDTQMTTATGTFELGGVSGAGVADKCTIVISKTGFATATLASTATCFRSTHTHNLGKPCTPSEGRVTLTP